MYVISERTVVVDKFLSILKQADALWIRGPISTGKTSLAVLIAKKTSERKLWIECRDLKSEQLIEQLITLLCTYHGQKILNNYRETVELLFTKIESQAIIILNDIPDLTGATSVQGHLSDFIRVAANNEVCVLITSNYHVPFNMGELHDLDIQSHPIPPFSKEETASLFQHMGASESVAEAVAGLVTTITDGHPLIINSAGKYLREREWNINEQTLTSIFSGKFDEGSERHAYAKLIQDTADLTTRNLLYRLKFVIGRFGMDIVEIISSIEPAIDRPGERINQLKGTWLQENGNGYLLLSPLIKRLDDNVDLNTKHKIYKKLAKQIIEKKNISQIDAATAILYFSLGHDYNNAAFILLKVQLEFAKSSQLFFDWGFDLFWYYHPFPPEVIPLFKVQIRIFQITFALEQKRDIGFVCEDLRNILEKEEVGSIEIALSNMLFFRLSFNTDPLEALNSLVKAKVELKKIDELFKEENELFNDELLNGIWIAFSQIHKNEEYELWFEKFTLLKVPPSIFDPYKNEMYVMAGVSIYRNAVLKNKASDGNTSSILHRIIQLSLDNSLFLLATYGLKFLIKYLAESHKDLGVAKAEAEKFKYIWDTDPVYKFLVIDELGRQCFYLGFVEEALDHLKEISNISLPKFYTEALDYLIAYAQALFKKDIKESSHFADKSLQTVLNSNLYLIEDKIKLYGEAAIGKAHTSNINSGFYLLSDGYNLLLENFKADDEFKSMVIRYGSVVLFLNQILTFGTAPDFGENQKFVVPEAGFFYRSNEKLLEGGFYFDERKFMVASILQDGFEAIGDLNNASKWAYKSIELSIAVSEARFVPILQKNIFYLIIDKQYRQAYNVLAHVDRFYAELLQKNRGGKQLSDGLKELLDRAQQNHSIDNDYGIYLNILLPVAFSVSLDIIENKLSDERRLETINAAFESDKYAVKDKETFALAKKLFEQIIIDNISYTQMQALLQNCPAEYKNILYVIGCILLSGFTNASEAANLQLAVIMDLEKVFRSGLKGFYRFCMVPYFENFWKQKFISHSSEFSSKEHLTIKGFPLIERAEWSKKIQTIFRVFVSHLDIKISTAADDFINNY